MTKATATKRSWPRKLGIALLVLLVAAVPIGALVWYKLFREVPNQFDTAADQFKYSSIGNENTDGIPYWIWLVLPRIFPEYLPKPGGYAALGLFWEPGRDAPAGFSTKTVGFKRVAINCAFCHMGSYRDNPEALPVTYPGGASINTDVQGYIRFLSRCASDPRFNADIILQNIAYETELSWIDRLLYRFALIPMTRKALLEQKARMAWTETRPDWGPGRIDPFNPIKFGILKLSDDGTIGNSDMVPVWNLDPRDGMALHWDGLNTSIHEVVVSSAIGDGATGKHFAWDSVKAMEQFLRKTKAPPFPYAHDADKAARGKAVFDRDCAQCHAFGGEKTGTVIPIAEVGTDPHRIAMWTDAARDAYNGYREGYDWDFSHFQNVEGYVAVPLDGLWLRAPYLHNGSVPTLRDLLTDPARRPTTFFRGYNQLDRDNLGYVAQGLDAERGGVRFDVSVAGNGNAGHTYGTGLPDDEKDALIEYLKIVE
jgi:hypothetical protein